MDEKTETNHIAAADINADFEKEISLHRLIGNKTATDILKVFVQEYQNDNLTGRNPQISPVLLVGSQCRTTMARAFHNSFGNLYFKYSHGSWFAGVAQNLNNFYYHSSYGMTFYIADIDKLNIVSQYSLWKILSERRLIVYEGDKIPIHAPLLNSLHIFSAKNTDNITEPLLSKFQVKINIATLTKDEIFAALKQRANLLKLSYESDQVLFDMAAVSGRDIDRAMELFSLGYRLMRANNETTLTAKIMNRAFRLMDANIKAAAKE